MNDWQRLDELLERGLDFYGRQLVSEAIQCWREVLYLSPGHQLALEYLEAAGASPDEDFQPAPAKSSRSGGGAENSRSGGGAEKSRSSATMTAPPPPVEAPAEEPPLTLESLSVLAVELIRERRLEDALALLYTAHGEAPKDQSISRSINVIKQRLTREYRAEIGDLGQIPHLTVDDALIDELDLSEDEREVLRLIDGIVALDDVVQTSGFALLQIYRVLAQLLRRNLIVLKSPVAIAEPAKAARVDDGPRTKTAPFRPTLVPPAPPVAAPTPASTGPKLVALPPLPEPPPESLKPAAVAPTPPPAATPAPSATTTNLPAAPTSSAIGFSPTAASAASSGAPAKEAAKPSAAPAAPMPVSRSTSTTMPIPAAPANTAPVTAPMPSSSMSFNAGPLAASATSVSVKTAAAAAAAASTPTSAPGSSLDLPGSGPVSPDSPPRRPSPYAAHVAEAVRAHLQGKQARAKELLALCVAECPDDPAARRNLERLKERLGVKE